MENPTLPWNWESVSHNPNITLQDVIWPFRRGEPVDYPVYYIYSIQQKRWKVHTTVSWVNNRILDQMSYTVRSIDDVINSNSNTDWCFGTLSRNPNIMLRDVLRYTTYPWCWTSVINTKTDYVRLYKAIRIIQKYWRKFKY